MAKIDFLLPFWGDVELFKLTVNSVLAQTEQDWTLMIFDDAYPSTEQKDFVDSLNDSRINYHRHPKNLGITPNFNYALSQAKSPYFVMLGCDDILLPNYAEIALNEIDEATFYQPAVQVIDQDGNIYLPLADKIKSFITPKPGLYSGESLAISLCHGNWLYFPSILWQTSTVQKYKFDNKYKIAEDLLLELQLILDGHSLKVGATPLFQYRRFAQSLSSKEKKRGGVRFNEEKDVYTTFKVKFAEKGWKKAARAASFRITSRLHEITNL